MCRKRTASVALATKNNMALPSRPQTFAYENCRELHAGIVQTVIYELAAR